MKVWVYPAALAYTTTWVIAQPTVTEIAILISTYSILIDQYFQSHTTLMTFEQTNKDMDTRTVIIIEYVSGMGPLASMLYFDMNEDEAFETFRKTHSENSFRTIGVLHFYNSLSIGPEGSVQKGF